MKKSINPRAILLSRIIKHIYYLHKFYVDTDIEISLLMLRNEIEEFLCNKQRISKKKLRYFKDKFQIVVFGYSHEVINLIDNLFSLLLTL